MFQSFHSLPREKLVAENFLQLHWAEPGAGTMVNEAHEFSSCDAAVFVLTWVQEPLSWFLDFS